MSAKSYLNDTEAAVQHLFDGLNSYDSLRPPLIMNYIDETGVVRMTKTENEDFLAAYERFFDLEFAIATLAGSLLQVAYNCLKQYSSGIDDDTLRSKFGVQSGTTAEIFCIGRKVHEIPIGLLIYAGRIQYNHWEDGEPSNAVAKNVFRELIYSYHDDPTFDLAYELDYPAPRPVSHYIVRLELRWRTYDEYKTDMVSLLNLE